MKRFNDVEDLYKDMFSDYSPEPPSHVWENIQAITRPPKKSSLGKKITFPIAGVIVVSAVVYLLVTISQQDETVVAMTDNKKTVEKVNPVSEQPNRENISDLSMNVNPPASQQTNSTRLSSETGVQVTEHSQNINPPINNNLSEMQSDAASKQSVPADKKDTVSTVTTPPVKHVQEQNTAKVSQNRNLVPKIAKISKDTTVCENTAVHLYAYNVENVRWSTGETQNLITVYPSYEEQYGVTFTTANMKDTTVYIYVKVIECTDIFIPNAFTPNGDGLNDIFLIKTDMELAFFEMTIYASNGKQILFTSKNSKRGWDGTYRGQIQPHGLYFYTVRYTDNLGRNIEKRGELLLILQ
jgi:gliding motility-associated-like protein